MIDDAGSGALRADLPQLADEPDVAASVAAGAALVCFSGDKLLGGPQAGFLVGTAEAIAACRAHPLARAMRIGRLPLAALEATLALYRDPERARRELPVLRMLTASEEELLARARRIAEATGGSLIEASARAGGGALPLLDLPGPAVAIDPPGGDAEALAARLRASDPPLVARIAGGQVIVDPRTLAADELATATRILVAALRALKT